MQAWAYAPPKLMAEFAKAGKSPHAVIGLTIKAMATATAELAKWDSSADVKALKEVGALDPTFKYDWSTYAADADPRYGNRLRDHLTGISILSGIEANAVRRPAALMFLHMLRELGYDQLGKSPKEIYYVAKEMTDHYMVSTKWYEKPHAFSRSGIVGMATSPLQSFTTTWIGMLREYGRLSASGALEGSVAKQLPLLSFMALNLTTAGVLGLVGIKEWDALAYWLNKVGGFNIPTGTEFVMSKFNSTKVRFGLLSDAVGAHIGATFNAPTLTGSFAPGLQFMGNVANFAKQMGREYLAPTGLTERPTSVEKRDALKGVAPRFSPFPGANWGDIEKAYTPEGAPYQDSAGNAGPVTRDSKDWMARRLGTYTNKEATAKTENYILKKSGTERSGRLSSAMNRAVDQMLMQPGHENEAILHAIDELKADGFSGDDLKNGLKREILSKILESDDRMMKGKGTKTAHLYKLLESLR
jgi:hypothetical protein